jgi:hypothetical protein
MARWLESVGLRFRRMFCLLYGHSDVRIFKDTFDPKALVCVCRACGDFWQEMEP